MTIYHKRHTFFFTVIMVGVFLFVPVLSGAATVEIVTEAWPPYVFQEEGQITGFDYEVVKAVLEDMGHEVSMAFYPWKRCLAMIEAGTADALLDVGRNIDREAVMAFPEEPLSTSSTVLFFLKETPFVFRNFEDLQGMKVGTQLGYSYSEEFAAAEGFTKEPVDSVKLNIKKLLHKRINLFMANRSFGLYMAKMLGVQDYLAHTDKAVSGGDVYLAFSRNSPLHRLVPEFGKALKRFKKTKRYRAIMDKYGQQPGP